MFNKLAKGMKKMSKGINEAAEKVEEVEIDDVKDKLANKMIEGGEKIKKKIEEKKKQEENKKKSPQEIEVIFAKVKDGKIIKEEVKNLEDVPDIDWAGGLIRKGGDLYYIVD